MSRRSIAVTGIISIMVILLLTPAICGCGGSGGENTPQAVADEFLGALVGHDGPGSYALISEKSKGECGITNVSWSGIMLKNPISESATYTLSDAVVEGDTAEVTVESSSGETTMHLSREDGEWRVDYELGEWYLAPAGS